MKSNFPSKFYSPDTIWLFGKNQDGQLITDEGRSAVADRTNNVKITPISEHQLFPYGDKLKWIGAGDHFTIFVTRSNVVYGAGQNTSGQLGLDHNRQLEEKIVRITFFDHKNIAYISCGAYFTYYLEEVGNSQIIYVCGKNTSGQLGLGERQRSRDRIEKIVCGYESTLLLTKQGHLYGCGSNGTNQLGTFPGSEEDSISSFTHCIYELLPNEKIIDVSLGTSYVLILTDHGNVLTNNITQQPYTKIGTSLCAPFSKIHFGASICFLQISKNHPDHSLAGRVMSFTEEYASERALEEMFYSLDDKTINSQDFDLESISGLTGFFFISKDYKVYCLGTNESNECGLDSLEIGSVTEPMRHLVLEDIITRTLSFSKQHMKPTIVCGYSHSILYFSSQETRDYRLFFGNLEKHASHRTALSDISFVFLD
ncbi:hypothetical protein C9374_013872 [Naegleria lovaniensis]|uniref:Uncharacterized protein n=1 Tax=Naegleria lovaniensis TaxID=51637 RepID=A0AA88GYA4_NAELO|nr:uncharacterized protein C9374_013872 [Naegleria lovaniensis]KAG2389312.1 hypothetical protein C9374_013872 [Naegleria lovaniensis]